MNTSSDSTRAERLGRWLGKKWRCQQRREGLVAAVLQERGVPIQITTVLIWILKLSVLGGVAYSFFWIAFILAIVMLFGWGMMKANVDDFDDQPEWRDGSSGYGLYRGGNRVDVGISDDD
ncbi:DUF3742 family protein [Pseudomonas huaxiensis]|uniref:DUF3742 family protein n=1 Tax=Pseudomonas huaxiensis TaxID=2213017 RepID=UPI000DA6DB5C|nr:DUF3742 family protein [Pseudomonas huaxiensis]